MNASDPEAARHRLDDEAYRPLWSAARARLERTGLTISNRPIKIQAVGTARMAIAGLVGTSPAGSEALSIRLDRLDHTLRCGAAAIDLISLLERIDGPLVDRRRIRSQRAAVLSSTWQSLEQHPAITAHPRLTRWLDGLRSTGVGLRLAGSIDALEPLVRQALDVMARLPVDNVPLAVFAATVTGDAHALDRSAALGSLTAGGLYYLDAPPVDGQDDPPAAGAELSWREAWSRVGVACDDVSASVLVLNIGPASWDGPVSSAIAQHRRAGLPLRLTLQQLRSESIDLPAGVVVRSCENPSVVAQAAASLGAESGPLICTDGQPNSAVDELIRQLTAAGTRVAHHGDFDWGGIRIANSLITRHHIDLWRFSTPDYLEASDVGRVPLDSPRHPVVASWDPKLVPTMRTAARCVFEEQVMATLIADLRS